MCAKQLSKVKISSALFLEISHASQILRNNCQILVLSYLSNYYCKSNHKAANKQITIVNQQCTNSGLTRQPKVFPEMTTAFGLPKTKKATAHTFPTTLSRQLNIFVSLQYAYLDRNLSPVCNINNIRKFSAFHTSSGCMAVVLPHWHHSGFMYPS